MPRGSRRTVPETGLGVTHPYRHGDTDSERRAPERRRFALASSGTAVPDESRGAMTEGSMAEGSMNGRPYGVTNKRSDDDVLPGERPEHGEVGPPSPAEE